LFLDKDALVSTSLLTKKKRKLERKTTSSPHSAVGARGPAAHAAVRAMDNNMKDFNII
jgi:hypothetical protein